MKVLLAVTATWLGVFAAIPATHAADGKIAVVAAENFYGDLARQIGGEQVAVTSIMSNPDQDPHLFEVSPTIIRQIAGAQIVVYNGADYDPWMEKLLAATPKSGRGAIVAADLLHRKPGDNPHLWYDPATMPAVASTLAAALSAADPAHANDYATRLKTFLASLAPLNEKIAGIRGKYAGVPVTATEPVFGYMADALKLKMRNERLQLAIMNDTEPSIRDVAAFERDLKQHRVRVLFYNRQASNTLVQHLVELARSSGVAVVGVTETCPPGVTYQEWMKNELDATDRALSESSS
ncbi:MAG TPA: zinc ABC transporter substrate-binding protein [Xanthobacteraceae bacterium]|nr:zinc ABC transporter substrate-binding protein [Xanthobacteraceae bacterium]